MEFLSFGVLGDFAAFSSIVLRDFAAFSSIVLGDLAELSSSKKKLMETTH